MSTQALSEVEVAAIKKTIESFTRCLEAGEFEDWVSCWAADGLAEAPKDQCQKLPGRDWNALWPGSLAARF